MLTMKALFHRIFVCCSLFVPQEFSLSDYDFQQRLSDCIRANPFFFLRRKKNLKKKELQGGYPLDPPLYGGDTTTACGISGMVQYRSHNADRSKRGLLNVLPRTSSLASPRGLRSRGAAMNRSPGETENRSSACGTATDTSRNETAPPAGGDEV